MRLVDESKTRRRKVKRLFMSLVPHEKLRKKKRYLPHGTSRDFELRHDTL